MAVAGGNRVEAFRGGLKRVRHGGGKLLQFQFGAMPADPVVRNRARRREHGRPTARGRGQENDVAMVSMPESFQEHGQPGPHFVLAGAGSVPENHASGVVEKHDLVESSLAVGQRAGRRRTHPHQSGKGQDRRCDGQGAKRNDDNRLPELFSAFLPDGLAEDEVGGPVHDRPSAAVKPVDQRRQRCRRQPPDERPWTGCAYHHSRRALRRRRKAPIALYSSSPATSRA